MTKRKRNPGLPSNTKHATQHRNIAPIELEIPEDEPPSKSLKGMKPIHPWLPQIPFYAGIIGPRNRGKTVLLFNLLGPRPGMYGDAFRKKNIIFFSPTKDKDPTLRRLKLPWVYGPRTPASLIVSHVQAKQASFAKSGNMTGVLLAFDDITQLREAWKPLEELSYFGRHDHIHVLYVAHKMSSIPRGVRTQTQQWMIYKPHEESEIQWILDMFSRKRTRDVWDNALRRVWKDLHNFAYIDFERSLPEEVYRAGFNEPLFSPEEIAFLEGDLKYVNTDLASLCEEMEEDE